MGYVGHITAQVLKRQRAVNEVSALSCHSIQPGPPAAAGQQQPAIGEWAKPPPGTSMPVAASSMLGKPMSPTECAVALRGAGRLESQSVRKLQPINLSKESGHILTIQPPERCGTWQLLYSARTGMQMSQQNSPVSASMAVTAENISKQGRSSHCMPLDGIHSRVSHIQALAKPSGFPLNLATA